MAYNQPTGQGMVQIIRRPMTDQEQANALSYYGVMRKAVRGLAAASFMLFIINLGILLGGFPVPDLEIVFAILGLVLGLVALGLSATMMGLRRKTTAALADGTVIEVRAPAYQNRAMGSKANSWNIGPLSLMTSPELQPLLVEGAQASVVCIPGIKVALAVNGTSFKRPPMLTAPPNLAAMATEQAPGAAPPIQPMQAQQPAQQPQYQPPPGQPAQYQQPPPQYQPQPPAPPQPQAPQPAWPQHQMAPQGYPPQPPQPNQPRQQPQPPAYPPQPQPVAYPQQPPAPQPQPQPYPQQPQQPQPQPQPYSQQPQQPQAWPQPHPPQPAPPPYPWEAQPSQPQPPPVPSQPAQPPAMQK